MTYCNSVFTEKLQTKNHVKKLALCFDKQTDHLISARRLNLVIVNNNKKKRTCPLVNFVVLADNSVNLKESEKRDKYLDLARKLKKRWNIEVTVIPTVIDALGAVIKGLIQGLEDLKISGWVEIIQTTALSRSARILRRVQETWENLMSLRL